MLFQTKLRKRKNTTADTSQYNKFETRPTKKRINDLDIGKFNSWDAENVASFLQDNDLGDVASVFKENGVTGKDLMNIDVENFQAYGISDETTINKLNAALKLFQEPSTSGSLPFTSTIDVKVFNDPVHGHIELHPLLVKIIDTPQFQRLRNIKQLGGCYFVFPGAAHNRFEHSIGTSHLAGRLIKSLQKRQPELHITEQDVLCVRIAGLCHDLGHGPFSHMFDIQFIPAARPGCSWKHEEASVMMFDHLVKKNNLDSEFKTFGLSNEDMTFIKELIAGPRGDTPAKTQDWPYFGRPKDKSYLYEIVANKRTGIDVDKWDYFSRDCHNLGIKNSFDHRRYIKMARVIKVDQRFTICVRDKEAGNIYDMFHTRFSLFRRAYQHKTSNIIEIMICEALLKADNYLKIEGENGFPTKMSQAIDDMVAYTKLSDHVYYQILYSCDPNLKPAKEILLRIEKRQLYKCIGQTIIKVQLDKDEIPDIVDEIISRVPPDMGCGRALQQDDITIDLVTFDYGMKDRNPIDNLHFYTKNEPNKAQIFRKDQVSRLLPAFFREQHMRIYCRSSDESVIEKAKTGFLYWCAGKECTTPKFGDSIAELTPMKTTSKDITSGNVATTLEFSDEDELINCLE